MGERRITADLLVAKGACPDQLDNFRERWPDGLDVETVTPGEVAGLSVGWAVRALLPASAWKAFKEDWDTAWKAYTEAAAASWKAYQEDEEYEGAEAARIARREASGGVTALAFKAYNEARTRAAIAVFREHWQEEESHDE